MALGCGWPNNANGESWQAAAAGLNAGRIYWKGCRRQNFNRFFITRITGKNILNYSDYKNG
jgi:hypothetical protein